MTPPRSSDQSEGFRAKNRPSLTTYASIVRPAAEFVCGLTIRADLRDGCSATSTEGSNRPLDDVWFAGCGRRATTVAPGHGKSIPGKAGGDGPLLKTHDRSPADCRPDCGGPGDAGRHHGGSAKGCIKRAISAGSPVQK